MKKSLLYTLYSIVGLLIVLYLSFLFVLPNVIDLNKFMPKIKNIAKEQAKIDIEINNPKVVTTFNLQAGIKTDAINVNLLDGSNLFKARAFQTRISIPQLFLLTVKIPCLEVTSPNVNLEIVNDEQFKLISLIEDILNTQKNKPVNPEAKPLPFDPSIIKIKVPNLKLTDYKVVINDLKNSHSLTLKGDKLSAGYNNGKTVRLKTDAQVLSDDNTNIIAKVNVSSFIPPASPADPDDDPAEKIVLPFVNPVTMFRAYDLKSNIDTKLKIRQSRNGQILMKGYLLVDDTTVNLSGLQLPKSFIKAQFKGAEADINTNFVVAQNQDINLTGRVNYGKKPRMNLNIFTDKIYFNDLLIISRALLDTLHVKHNLATIDANGYWVARTQVKTNFKNLKSKGSIIVRDGALLNDVAIFDKMNANLIFENDMLKIVDTYAYINNHILKTEGTIDANSYANIRVQSDNIPLQGLYNAFAPAELKKSIALSSGNLTLDAKINGELTKALTTANIILDDLSIQDKKNAFVLNNECAIISILTDLKMLDGNVINKNFAFTLPQTNSTIKVPDLTVKLDENNVNLLPFKLLVNSVSKIDLVGSILNYTQSPQIDFKVDGILNAKDLRQFAGRDAEPFISAVGNLPIKAILNGTDKKQDIVLQIKSDAENYLTPIDIEAMQGKQSILQAKIDYKGDRLHIRNTGFYTGGTQFTDDFETNMLNTQKIVELSGTVVGLGGIDPVINIIKLDIPNEINAKISAFKNSSLKIAGGLKVFGKLNSPLLNSKLRIFDLNIPELLISMNETLINMFGKNIDVNVNNLLLNGSDINVELKTDINPHPQFTISKVDVNSKNIDLDKLMKITENLNKYMAPPLKNAPKSEPADIPVVIRNGQIDLKRIKTGNIVATNTTGKISMKNNNFFLDNLKTTAFDGTVRGNIIANLKNMGLDIKTQGSGLNVEKALFALANMKNTLTGDLAFKTDISLQGVAFEEQMKSLKGDVTFVMTDGQLGPFGKLENMILAENIRESQFFQTALGGVISNLTTVDTSHFDTLTGLISFEDGIAKINPITSVGNVMSLYIAGDFDLLKNTTDMKVRAKLGSFIADMLGPIAQLNPINLVKVTPGLNVVMAQAFSLFCEQLTPEETAAIPALPTKMDDDMATKFQIVLRGDVAKPLSLIKSFKWLALASEIEQAQGFVSTLPDPSIVADPNNATIEEIMKAQELKAKEDAKLINKVKRIFKDEE